MKLKSKLLLLLALINGPFVSERAHAFAGHGRPQFMRHFVSSMLDEALTNIQASTEQRQALQITRDRVMEAFAAHRKSRHARHRQLLELLSAEGIDNAKLDHLKRADAGEHAQLAAVVENALRDVHAVLTHEQRIALANYLHGLRHRHD